MPENVGLYAIHTTQGYYLTAGSVYGGAIFKNPVSGGLAGAYLSPSLSHITAIKDMLVEHGVHGTDGQHICIHKLLAVPV